MPRHDASKTRAQRAALVLLLPASAVAFALLQSRGVANALALPSFRRSDDRRRSIDNARGGSGNKFGSITSGSNQQQIETQVYGSAGRTTNDAEAGGLRTMRTPRGAFDNDNDDGHDDGRGRQRGLFAFKDRRSSDDDDRREKSPVVPFGPVPRGGSQSDIAVLPTGSVASAACAAVALPGRLRSNNPLAATWTNVRSGARGVRRGIVKTRSSLRVARRQIVGVVAAANVNVAKVRIGGGRDGTVAVASLDLEGDATVVDANIDGRSGVPSNRGNVLSMLRVGGRFNRQLRQRRAAQASATAANGVLIDGTVGAARMETVDCLDGMAEMDARSHAETVMLSVGGGAAATAIETAHHRGPPSLPIAARRLFQRRDAGPRDVVGVAYESAMAATTTASAEALSSRGGSGVEAAVLGERAGGAAPASTQSPATSSASIGPFEIDTYVIETPLFPIILPEAFRPPSAASVSASSVASSAATLEISVALEEEGATSGAAEAEPSPQLLQAATMPLLPKALVDSFTGREFYRPESMEALAATGLRMTLGEGSNAWVDWSGEKKTDAFLRAHGVEGKASDTREWYEALDSSQEVLVWAGKSTSRDGYGADLPIIKTTSIIRQSPKYLAELLMDSSQVKVYNKMSLGRTDEKVFQTGVDTQGGSFGDGESKVVRNLTKPPMVSSIIEFVTCMHARKLRPDDMNVLSPGKDGNAAPAAADGYIVVSRAITGGEWSADGDDAKGSSKNGEKLVRNEILLGVNVLRAVLGDPNKTELTSVTHVYSPMIPLMLAKNAGVKGAVDFVRDVRALP